MKKDLLEKFDDFISSGKPMATAAQVILVAALSGSILFAGPAVPGVIKAIDSIGKLKRFRDDFKNRQFNNAFNNLKRRKLIRVIEDKNGKARVELTIDGRKKVREFMIDSLVIKQPKKWDRKWRVLIFDIPADKKLNPARNALRDKIKELGFAQLQKSTWIYPFPCEEEILFVAETYNITKYIEILVVEKLLHENLVKARFKSLAKTLL